MFYELLSFLVVHHYPSARLYRTVIKLPRSTQLLPQISNLTSEHQNREAPRSCESSSDQNHITMAENDYQSFKHFIIRFPAEHQYVAHVEINRPDKLNAFFEA